MSRIDRSWSIIIINLVFPFIVSLYRRSIGELMVFFHVIISFDINIPILLVLVQFSDLLSLSVAAAYTTGETPVENSNWNQNDSLVSKVLAEVDTGVSEGVSELRSNNFAVHEFVETSDHGLGHIRGSLHLKVEIVVV